MKKLLWIVVLGLVLTGNAFANIFNCVIDDYNLSQFTGAKTAVDDFLKKNEDLLELIATNE